MRKVVYSLRGGFYNYEYFFDSEPFNQGFCQNFKKNLAPLIVAQFSETLTRPLMAIRKISNTRGMTTVYFFLNSLVPFQPHQRRLLEVLSRHHNQTESN